MTTGYYGQSVNTHPHGGTPDWLIEELQKEHGELFDPCPNDPTFNGLEIEWPTDKTVFVNPPYTRGEIVKWVEKCGMAWLKGSTVVLLIPSYTDTQYFHKYIYPYTTLKFLEGRLRFKGYNGKSAAFPSMICTWEQ